VKTYHKTF